MALIVFPHTFGGLSGPIPLSYLDENFEAINDAGVLTSLDNPTMVASLDQSITSSTVLANATGFSFPIAATEQWIATYSLNLGDATQTTGEKFAVTVPVGATMSFWVSQAPHTIDAGVSQVFALNTQTGGAALTFTTAQMVNSDFSIVAGSVWVLNGANAGTVQLQFAQATSSGTALTLKRGSFGIARQIV